MKKNRMKKAAIKFMMGFIVATNLFAQAAFADIGNNAIYANVSLVEDQYKITATREIFRWDADENFVSWPEYAWNRGYLADDVDFNTKEVVETNRNNFYSELESQSRINGETPISYNFTYPGAVLDPVLKEGENYDDRELNEKNNEIYAELSRELIPDLNGLVNFIAPVSKTKTGYKQGFEFLENKEIADAEYMALLGAIGEAIDGLRYKNSSQFVYAGQEIVFNKDLKDPSKLNVSVRRGSYKRVFGPEVDQLTGLTYKISTGYKQLSDGSIEGPDSNLYTVRDSFSSGLGTTINYANPATTVRAARIPKIAEVVTWTDLVIQAKGSLIAETYTTHVQDVSVVERMVTELFSWVRGIMASILGENAEEIIFNQGVRAEGMNYEYGMYPNSWEPVVRVLYTITSMVAIAFLGFSLFAMLTKKTISLISPQQRYFMHEQIKGIVYAAIIIGIAPLAFRELGQLNYYIVNMFGALLDGSIFENLTGLAEGSLATIIAEVVSLGVLLYVTYLYVLRSVLIVSLFVLTPYFAYTLTNDPTGKKFMSWATELTSNIFLQSVHALSFLVLLKLPFDTFVGQVVTTILFLKISQILKSLFLQGRTTSMALGMSDGMVKGTRNLAKNTAQNVSNAVAAAPETYKNVRDSINERSTGSAVGRQTNRNGLAFVENRGESVSSVALDGEGIEKAGLIGETGLATAFDKNVSNNAEALMTVDEDGNNVSFINDENRDSSLFGKNNVQRMAAVTAAESRPQAGDVGRAAGTSAFRVGREAAGAAGNLLTGNVGGALGGIVRTVTAAGGAAYAAAGHARANNQATGSQKAMQLFMPRHANNNIDRTTISGSKGLVKVEDKNGNRSVDIQTQDLSVHQSREMHAMLNAFSGGEQSVIEAFEAAGIESMRYNEESGIMHFEMNEKGVANSGIESMRMTTVDDTEYIEMGMQRNAEGVSVLPFAEVLQELDERGEAFEQYIPSETEIIDIRSRMRVRDVDTN